MRAVRFIVLSARPFLSGLVWGVLLASLGPCLSARSQTNLSVYSDQLNNGFQDWSWGTRNFSCTSPVHSGTHSITFSGSAWQAISLFHPEFNPRPYTNLDFWANGGTDGGQILRIYLEYGTNSTAAYTLSALPTNAWRRFFIPFASLNASGVTNLKRINLQLTSAGKTGAFYLDDVNLVAVPPVVVSLSVDAGRNLRTADARWFGLNTAVWDGNLDTAATSNALVELGTRFLRFPGGSLSDDYHWWNGKSSTNSWAWSVKFKNFVHVATNAGAEAVITVNYGSGTAQEAAAWVRHANVTNRLAFRYWEVGNENYGTWETDTNTLPHDGFTYASRAAAFFTQMRAADPSIKIGVPVITGENTYVNGYTNHPVFNARTGQTNYGWTPVVLATLKSLGITPDFLVYHVYPQYQSDSDQYLLQAAASWAPDAADLRQQITDYFGAGGTNIELLCTENNADSGNQGRQSTSIVNGLYLADSLAQLMKTEFNGFMWWDLRNGADTNGDFSPSLHGWRTNGDLGIIGGLNTRYPVFHAFKLMQYFVQPGDAVLNASSDYNLLTAYAARSTNGTLSVLVINKDVATTFASRISLADFIPWTNAMVRSYGLAQDEAARTNAPAAMQDIATNSLAVPDACFTAAFPPYSLSLLTLPPAAPFLEVFPDTNGSVVLSVLGQREVRYILQNSTNMTTWASVATNTLPGSAWNVTNAVTQPFQFWRAVWLP